MFWNDLGDKQMQILIGVLLYLFAVVFFIAFGKFLKECDDSVTQGMMGGSKAEKHHHYPSHRTTHALR